MDENEQINGVFRFSYKRWRDHLKGIFTHPLRLLFVCLTIFGMCWTLYEATDYVFHFNLSDPWAYFYLCLFSVLAGIAWELRSYLVECPAGLESLPPATRRIAHLQRTKWEFEFAKKLLAQRLGPLDEEYAALIKGRTFIQGSKPRDINEYVQWLIGRPENSMRMLMVAKSLLLHELPEALVSTEDKHASPNKILSAVEKIERFYRDTIEFERATQSVIPPKPFAYLHELQRGWSQPVRDAIVQVFPLLQKLCDAHANEETDIEYQITFGEPPNMNEFLDEIDRLEPLLPAIVAGLHD